MLDWVKTAFDTYVLHPLHGNGGAFWSGPGSDLAYVSMAYAMWRKHNCLERWCLRIGTHKSQLDGHVRCHKHHKIHKDTTNYVDAKQRRVTSST